jgi:hypothetical protein
MMPSTRKNNTLHLHSKLALEIKAAKKTMFRNHREGLNVRDAADKFVIDVSNRLGAILPRDEGNSDDHTKPEPEDDDRETELAALETDLTTWIDDLTATGDPEVAESLFNLLAYREIVTSHGDPRQRAIFDLAADSVFAKSTTAYEVRRRLLEGMERRVIRTRYDTKGVNNAAQN